MTGGGIAIAIDLVGSAVVVGVPDQSTADRLIADWSRCGAVSWSGDQDGENGSPMFTVTGEEVSLYGLATNLTIRLIGVLAGTHVLLHAAGAASQDGQVLTLVGTSGAGKTTAASRLCRSRFGYVTDELVAIDPSGTVIAYPKPLSVVAASATSAKHQYGPDQLGLRPAPAELTSGPFIFLERRPDAGAPELHEVPLVEALLDLLPHTSSITLLPDPLQVLCALLSHSGAYRLTYAEIDDTAPLLGAFSTTRAPVEEWHAEPEPGTEPLLWDGLYRRAPLVDAVRVGDQVVALGTGAPVRILGIGVPVWEAAAEAATFQDLVATAVAVHGPHPDAEGLVQDATLLMVEAGILHCERPLTLGDVMAGRSVRGDTTDSHPLP